MEFVLNVLKNFILIFLEVVDYNNLLSFKIKKQRKSSDHPCYPVNGLAYQEVRIGANQLKIAYQNDKS